MCYFRTYIQHSQLILLVKKQNSLAYYFISIRKPSLFNQYFNVGTPLRYYFEKTYILDFL